ncbi:proteasome subunit beta type-6-like [Zingiber officinale]|uniref:proteasome subunit beta type-6-like n=1 Tax=Zingiber officinale TaxID=94328 RepID=UPI001C4C6229|nr:proteasome subunit beta type-6-like [Zingiber officinale]
MGVIVGGWDKYEGGKIFTVAQGATILKLSYAIYDWYNNPNCENQNKTLYVYYQYIESGSRHIKEFFDKAWKEGMRKVEADILVVKAVLSLAIADDEASGGLVRTVTINSDGVMKKILYTR